MTDILTIGAMATRAYSRALDVVSTNIANVDNPDYVRRRIDLQEMRPSDNNSVHYLPTRFFGGVNAEGVNRSFDQAIERDVRFLSSSSENAQQQVRWLEQVELALDDSEGGVGQRMDQLHATAIRLTASVGDPILRQQFTRDIDAVAKSIAKTGNALTDIRTRIGEEASSLPPIINNHAEQLSHINENLLRARPNTADQLHLLDTRDKLLRDLSQYAAIEATPNPDNGDKGIMNVSINGVSLVDGIDASTLSVDIQGDGSLDYAIDGIAINAPTDGRLAALSASVHNVNERKAEFDILAGQFVDRVNQWHAAGTNDNGDAGTPLLAITATDASTIAAIPVSPLNLALARGTDANANARAFYDIQENDGAQDQWKRLVAANGQMTQLAQLNAESITSQADNALQTREQISGVDLDREAADLIRYQQAFSASARIIQVAQDTFNSILDAV